MRRLILTVSALGALAFFGVSFVAVLSRADPEGIVEIGHVPQFFIDDGIVDNRWAIRYEDGSKEMVVRVLHPPRKDERNPLLSPELGADRSGPQPGFGAVNVIRDEAGADSVCGTSGACR